MTPISHMEGHIISSIDCVLREIPLMALSLRLGWLVRSSLQNSKVLYTLLFHLNYSHTIWVQIFYLVACHRYMPFMIPTSQQS